MAVEQQDRECAVYTWHTIKPEESSFSTGYNGYAATPYGFVRVQSHRWHDGEELTWLLFIYNECMYERRIEAFYLPRYLVTLAKRFAAYVVAKNIPEKERN